MERNDKIQFFTEIEADESKVFKERIYAGFEKMCLVNMNVLDLKEQVINTSKKI